MYNFELVRMKCKKHLKFPVQLSSSPWLDSDHTTRPALLGYYQKLTYSLKIGICPYEKDPSGEYLIVDSRCYYFEKNFFTFTEAVTNCKEKFNGKGRLFEPRSISSNNNVFTEAKTLSPNEKFWIGVRTQTHDSQRKFYYLSIGTSQSTIEYWATGEPNDFGSNEDCVSVLTLNEIKWGDSNCENQELSICQEGKRKIML